MVSLAVAAMAWEAVAFWLFPGPTIVSGRVLDGASVFDGDTLRIAGQRIRLYGIDAPELDQTCADGWPAGQEARRALAGIVTTRPLDCRYVTTDIYRRSVAICRVDGVDLSETLIRSAWDSPTAPSRCATCSLNGRLGSMTSASMPIPASALPIGADRIKPRVMAAGAIGNVLEWYDFAARRGLHHATGRWRPVRPCRRPL
jgi:hypothetical protein